MYNLDVVSSDPHLHHTAFSTACGLTRTVADSLNYWSSRSPTIHPSPPTSSRRSLKGCVSYATMRKRLVSAVLYPQLHFVLHVYLPFTAGPFIVKKIGQLTVPLPSDNRPPLPAHRWAFPLHQARRDVLHQRRRTRLAHRIQRQKLLFWQLSHLQYHCDANARNGQPRKRETVIDGTCTRRATLLKAEVEAP